MILHEVRILHEVHRLQRELAQALPAVNLSLYVACDPTTPRLCAPVSILQCTHGARPKVGVSKAYTTLRAAPRLSRTM